jgi:hypothetical protein
LHLPQKQQQLRMLFASKSLAQLRLSSLLCSRHFLLAVAGAASRSSILVGKLLILGSCPTVGFNPNALARVLLFSGKNKAE